MSEMSETTQEIVSAIANRKQEQNKKVSNLKTKFKVNVKVKIPIESTVPEPEPDDSPEQVHNDSTPFNLEDHGIDNAHHNAMTIR